MISLACMLISGSAGLLVWSRLPKVTRLLILQSFFAFIITIAARQWSPNTWLYNLYMPLDFALVICSSTAFLSRSFVKRYLPLSIGLYTIIWICSWVTSGLEKYLFNWSFLIGCVLISAFYMAVLFQATLKCSSYKLKSIYCLCLANLFYYAGAVPLFGLLNYLNIHYPATAKVLFLSNLVLSDLRYLLVGLFFISYARNNKRVGLK
jgi:hypothetical protein